MTQYFLTVPHDTETEPTMATMDPAELEAVLAAVDAFNAELKDAGAFVFAAGLNPPSTAKTVDVTSGETRVLDEPFTVAPSYVGGFWVIEAADDAAALDWTVKALDRAAGPHRGARRAGPAHGVASAPPEYGRRRRPQRDAGRSEGPEASAPDPSLGARSATQARDPYFTVTFTGFDAVSPFAFANTATSVCVAG